MVNNAESQGFVGARVRPRWAAWALWGGALACAAQAQWPLPVVKPVVAEADAWLAGESIGLTLSA